MDIEERVSWHLLDGSVVEVVGAQVAYEESDSEETRYWLQSGSILGIKKAAVCYYKIDKAPEGDGVC